MNQICQTGLRHVRLLHRTGNYDWCVPSHTCHGGQVVHSDTRRISPHQGVIPNDAVKERRKRFAKTAPNSQPGFRAIQILVLTPAMRHSPS